MTSPGRLLCSVNPRTSTLGDPSGGEQPVPGGEHGRGDVLAHAVGWHAIQGYCVPRPAAPVGPDEWLNREPTAPIPASNLRL
jgi:hypothetical protein